MNDIKKNKIEKFLNDEGMSNAVYEILIQSFLRPKTMNDVNMLAASRLAIDLLQDSWKELSKFKADEEKTPSQVRQVGL